MGLALQFCFADVRGVAGFGFRVFSRFFEVVLCCNQDHMFDCFLQIFASKRGPLSSQFLQISQLFHEEKKG